MAKRRDPGAQRLLEAWEPPSQAGEAIGCIATTFTFHSEFFEEHCLSRFLRLETDPREDGAAYLIEREEKLAAVTVSLLVDRSHAQGSQSPRWDVLAVSVPGAIQHAKIAVLAWERWVRILIGSANLTEPAYRQNHEVIGVLDIRDGGNVPVDLLTSTLDFLGRLAGLTPGSETARGPKARLTALLTQLGDKSRGWTAEPTKGWDSPRAVPIFLGPMPGYQDPVPQRVGQLVRERGGPATEARVLSPFFDQGAQPAYPGTQALLAALTDRGERTVRYLVASEALPDGRLRLHAPASILRAERKTARFKLYPVPEDAEGEHRPLHAKSLWLWNDRWHVYMVGSSNFTGAGLGLPGRAPNLEANLAYVFQEDGPMVGAMKETLPPRGKRVKDLDSVIWEPVDEAEGEEGTGRPVLPAGFEEALFSPDAEGGTLTLQLSDAGLPANWDIRVPGAAPAAGESARLTDAGPSLYTSQEWRAAGAPRKLDLAWRPRRVPTALEVHWRGFAGDALAAAWPVNVTDPGSLPAPEDLRNLSLDTLVEILGSRRPLHEAVLAAKGRKLAAGLNSEALPAEIDPHRKVRTETFLLQRTRRVARAVEQLLARLSRPVPHRDALAWRLRGPVGPLALARALAAEARSPGEAAFLLADLTLALRRLDIRAMAGGGVEEEIRRQIETVQQEIEALARGQFGDDAAVPPAMRDYVDRALQEARQ
jgi:hypothetical protein